jgi:coatomer subunit beta'
VGFHAEGLCGGFLLGVKGQDGIGMFDWETGNLVRRIEVEPREVCSMNVTYTPLLTAS